MGSKKGTELPSVTTPEGLDLEGFRWKEGRPIAALARHHCKATDEPLRFWIYIRSAGRTACVYVDAKASSRTESFCRTVENVTQSAVLQEIDRVVRGFEASLLDQPNQEGA